jgi:hypothetical protein
LSIHAIGNLVIAFNVLAIVWLLVCVLTPRDAPDNKKAPDPDV